MASGAAADARALLNAWRDSGADRLDPVRFRFLEALARRAANCDGDARRALESRLSQLLDAYRDAVERSADQGSHGNARTVLPAARCGGPLRGLVDYIASHRRPASGDSQPGTAMPARADAEPELVDYFRQTWTRLSADRELRQSLQRVPDNAGPLNSNHLIHRSLALMGEFSPGYLRQFLAYVDALARLERLGATAAIDGKDANRAPASRKSSTGKARR